MTPKRCICKRSQQYPLCDGSHADKDWCTVRPVQFIKRLVIASPSLDNLAEWWADKVKGHTLSNAPHPIPSIVEEVWILSDGTQFPILQALLEQVPHKRQRWVHTSNTPNFPAGWISARQEHVALPHDFDLDTLNPTSLPSIQPIQLSPSRIFVSHAVVDEAFLMPVLKRIEHLYGIQFFMCAEIGSEANWYAEIESHLRRCDLVWAFSSIGFTHSTFCAFEIGMTKALNKRLQIFSIDTSQPPAYLQHQQIHFVHRVHTQFPWLSPSDVLEQLCLTRLSTI